MTRFCPFKPCCPKEGEPEISRRANTRPAVSAPGRLPFAWNFQPVCEKRMDDGGGWMLQRCGAIGVPLEAILPRMGGGATGAHYMPKGRPSSRKAPLPNPWLQQGAGRLHPPALRATPFQRGNSSAYLGVNCGPPSVAAVDWEIPPLKGDQGGCCPLEQRTYPAIGSAPQSPDTAGWIRRAIVARGLRFAVS